MEELQGVVALPVRTDGLLRSSRGIKLRRQAPRNGTQVRTWCGPPLHALVKWFRDSARVEAETVAVLLLNETWEADSYKASGPNLLLLKP